MTSTCHFETGFGNRTSWNFTFGVGDSHSKRNHLVKVESPTSFCVANSDWVNWLWWNFANKSCRCLPAHRRRPEPVFDVSIPPWSHGLSPETRRGPSAAYVSSSAAVFLLLFDSGNTPSGCASNYGKWGKGMTGFTGSAGCGLLTGGHRDFIAEPGGKSGWGFGVIIVEERADAAVVGDGKKIGPLRQVGGGLQSELSAGCAGCVPFKTTR